MALDKVTLKASIKAAMLGNLPGAPTTPQNVAVDSLAGAIADAIDIFVKGGTVTVAPGIPVSTAGTAVAQTGATTSPGTGTIS